MAEKPTTSPTPPPTPELSDSAPPITPEKALETDLRRARRDKRQQQEGEGREEGEGAEDSPEGESPDEGDEDETSDKANAESQAAGAGKAMAQEMLQKKKEELKKKIMMRIAGVMAPYCAWGCLIATVIILGTALVMYLQQKISTLPEWAQTMLDPFSLIK
jgi:type IV secretory pathway VirB10-like protein